MTEIVRSLESPTLGLASVHFSIYNKKAKCTGRGGVGVKSDKAGAFVITEPHEVEAWLRKLHPTLSE